MQLLQEICWFLRQGVLRSLPCKFLHKLTSAILFSFSARRLAAFFSFPTTPWASLKYRVEQEAPGYEAAGSSHPQNCLDFLGNIDPAASSPFALNASRRTEFFRVPALCRRRIPINCNDYISMFSSNYRNFYAAACVAVDNLIPALKQSAFTCDLKGVAS